jgi:hypothetical protein
MNTYIVGGFIGIGRGLQATPDYCDPPVTKVWNQAQRPEFNSLSIGPPHYGIAEAGVWIVVSLFGNSGKHAVYTQWNHAISDRPIYRPYYMRYLWRDSCVTEL